MSPEIDKHTSLLEECVSVMMEIFSRCEENMPNFGVKFECFKESLQKTIRKFILNQAESTPSSDEIKQILQSIQAEDLFLALACAAGNERAWWEFDQSHRSYLERIARHLASSDVDAEEVVDAVYVELYGTKVVDGMRQSKFASYSGRGSLRGWLRTVVWHSLVDLHRSNHDEVSLDEMIENVGEGQAQSNFLHQSSGGEDEMLDQINRERYRKYALNSIETAFSALESHEKLLLLYYHVESLKLREIARIVQVPDSPLRNWFQRKTENRDSANGKLHESTVMRWLDKTYSKVLKSFRNNLANQNLGDNEIEICMEIVSEDLSNANIYKNLMTT